MARGTAENPFIIHVESRPKNPSKSEALRARAMSALTGAVLGAAITAFMFLTGIVGQDKARHQYKVPEMRLVDFLRFTKQELFNAQLPALDGKEAPAFKFRGFDLEVSVVAKEERTDSGKVQTTLFTVGSDFKGSAEETHKLVVHLDPLPVQTVTVRSKPGSGQLLEAPPPAK